MDRYQKVQKPRSESPINENEIRITSQGLVRNYINYATSLLHERQLDEIVLTAMGQAISKAVAIAEIMKRRTPQLHQDIAISSVSITDTFEPIEEGLETVEQTRHVSMISITLSKKGLNKNSPGYQTPSPNLAKQQYIHQPQQPPRQALAMYNSNDGGTYGQVRGRGWNRGGHTHYKENVGYSNWGRGGGLGGRGYAGVGYGRGGGGRGYGRARGRMGVGSGGGNQV